MEPVHFTIRRRILQDSLSAIKKLSPKFFKTGTAKICVLPEQIEIHVVGITKYLPAKTEKYCDVYVPIRVLYGLSSTITKAELVFTVTVGEIRCNDAIINSPEIKIANIFNTSEDVLPFNADDFYLLKYASKAGESEVADFGLTQKVKNAKEKLHISLQEALVILTPYKITTKDLEDLISKKFNEP